MPAPANKGKKEPEKKKKELPQELCGCGVDTYRAPPKGKKKNPAPIVHADGCQYQRTTCEAYPNLPKCTVCLNPCKWCMGKNRWCPHCYENQCQNRYKRIVHGWEPKPADANGTNGRSSVSASRSASVVNRRSISRKSTTGRSKSVTFVNK